MPNNNQKRYFSRLWEIASYVVLSTIVVHIVSAFTIDRRIEYLQITYDSAKITPSLDGYKMAFITDTHHMSLEELRKITDMLNECDLDLLLLGGDFHLYDRYVLGQFMEIMATVKTSDGIFGVEGNHDFYRSLFAAMRNFGITPLSNDGHRVREGLYICGVEDLWNRSADISMAISGAEQNDFVLLVSHNPDITMKQDTSKVDLILSGHTHGGHITLFGLWAPALHRMFGITRYGQRFMSGWAKSKDGSDVFVSRGTGKYNHIPRIFARPEVVLLTLQLS